MRGGPRQLLNLDADAGMRAFELREQRRDHLALAAHGPEAKDDRGGRATTARDDQERRDDSEGDSLRQDGSEATGVVW